MTYDEDHIYKKHEVKRCPDCGLGGMDNQAVYQRDDTGEYNWGYDVYCPHCEWGGYIYPDDILFEMEDYLEAQRKTSRLNRLRGLRICDIV